jgi:hypothetical protein
MKHLIILISLLTAPFIIQGQDHYEVVCKRTEGCPVVNGTCPTCTIVGGVPMTITDEEIDAWAKRMQERNKYVPLENDPSEGEASGWEWKGPTWRGLRVLY